MHKKIINPIIRWWVTPKLPYEDIYAKHNFVSQWITHPIKRRIARCYLKILQKFTDIKVLAITGSTGKTTTTEILASILRITGPTTWSKESVDPVYNIPNTILRTKWGTKFLILEMSVEYFNEMDFYLWLAQPDIGIVTNIAPSHTQFFKSIKGVAKEKGKLIKSLKKEGTAILNNEDSIARLFKALTKAKTIWYGENGSVCAKNVKLKNNMSTSFTLIIGMNNKNVHMKAFGNQFVINALASAAAASALGVHIDNIAHGIESFERPAHRLNAINSNLNGIIFDDTYNSNPKAAMESLETFNRVAGTKKKIAVVGDMLELGDLEESSHRALGEKIGTNRFEYLIGVGKASRYVVEEAAKKMDKNKCFLTSDYSEALLIAKPLLNKNTALFVKGSRSIHLDKLVDALI